MNTVHSDPDSRETPSPRDTPPETSVESVAIDLGHLANADLETALETAAWVIALCERRPARSRSVRAVRLDLGADRPARLLWLEGGDRPVPPSFGHS